MTTSRFTSVRFDEAFEKLLDDLRVTVRPVPTRSDTIRRCVEIVAAQPSLFRIGSKGHSQEKPHARKAKTA
jgi:hypothetical protein